MPRILKRPMFNRGGSSNQGIMDGLVDRTGFNEGTPLFNKETTAAQVKAILEAQNEFAPVPETRLPIGQFGAGLMAGKGFGDSAVDAYGSFVTADDKRRAAIAGRTGSAVSTSLGQQIAERNARLKKAGTSNMQKDYTAQRAYETQASANIESAGKLKSFQKPDINQAFPRATAEYDTYILRNLRSTNNLMGQTIAANNAGFVPFQQKTQTFDYNAMQAGVFYYDPRQRAFVQRIPASDDDEGGFFMYDKNTFAKRKIETKK